MITSTSLSSAFAPIPPRPGSAGLPLPGMDIRVVDDDGRAVKHGTLGNVVLARPLPPSFLTTLWRNDKRFVEAYFERFQGKGDWFDTGDAGIIEADGYVHILARTDDVLNVAGHRLSSSLIEQVVASHPLIAECCVVGVPDPVKGETPFAFATRAASKEAQSVDPATLLKDVNQLIRRDVGAIAALSGLVTGALPKTRSGKTLRRTIRNCVSHPDKPPDYPPTVESVDVVHAAHQAIKHWLRERSGSKL